MAEAAGNNTTYAMTTTIASTTSAATTVNTTLTSLITPYNGNNSCYTNVYPDAIFCGEWNAVNHPMFQVGNILIVVSLLALFQKPTLYWHLYERFFLSAGCWALTVWAWIAHCFPDIVAWNFLFGLMHLHYVTVIFFKLRPVRYFQPKIENVRQSLFSSAPLHAYHRLMRYADLELFQKGEQVQVHGHETLRLITSGKVQATANGRLLYHAYGFQFADSPSRLGQTMMPITLTMMEETEFLKWESSALHDIARDPELAPILMPVISADAAYKMKKLLDKVAKQPPAPTAAAVPPAAPPAAPAAGTPAPSIATK